MESIYTQNVVDDFNEKFKDQWIEDFDWNSSEVQALSVGIQKVSSFRQNLVVQYSKLVLSGDYLINEANTLDKLEEIINKQLDDIVTQNSPKDELNCRFQEMLNDVADSICVVKNYIALTKKRFQPNKLVISLNLISNNKYKNNELKILDWVCDSCEAEYYFSYNDDYIKRLLYIRQFLYDKRNKYKNELAIVLNAALSKIELLLGKLSAFSENKKIYYCYNLKLETIELEEPDNYPKEDFRNLFQKYLAPSTLDSDIVLQWQQNSMRESVDMWKLAFLMRYYTKQTKCIEQIDRLIELTDYHNKDYLKQQDRNIVNDYAGRSFLNYMYNSRFSFLCKCDKDYSYERMKNDLSKIESIQAETFIENYHPYQTAVEFTIKIIDKKLSNYEVFEDVSSLFNDLISYFEKYKKCIVWCKKYQPYLVQLRYKFSCITFEGCDFETFCPSSFCRPLRFKELDEKVFEYASKIAQLNYETHNQGKKKMLMEAISKIDNMERKNMEQMGLFITLTTFLVGLLSIFIGNDGNVTIIEKMNYVIILGLILIIFVSLGYFVISKTCNNLKKAIFIVLLVGAIASVFLLCYYK